MFGLGPLEMGVIALLALLLFGARLPKLARSLGSTVVEFKRGFRENIEEPVAQAKGELRAVGQMAKAEIDSATRDVRQGVRDVQDSVTRMSS